MSYSKEVETVEEYTFRETDFVSIMTKDEWIYRFMRPSEHEPYRLDRKQRPDGEYTDRKSRTPQPVVDFMVSYYDCAQLQPERTRSDPEQKFNA